MKRLDMALLFFLFLAGMSGMLHIMNGPASTRAQALYRLGLGVVGLVGAAAVLIWKKRNPS
jgi:hypothetical protein